MFVGAEVFLKNDEWIRKFKSKKIAYLGNASSVTSKGTLVLEHLKKNKDINLTSIFSPQHGFYGLKQANMITSENSTWSDLPLFSLYSQKTRRFTPQMKNTFDVLLIDLQDVGCRIYTYLSTLFYAMEDCEQDKTIVILDRPNPLGRNTEGNYLDLNFKSFVGVAAMPISHGLTLGEAALWFKNKYNLKTDLHVVKMESYLAEEGWPHHWPWLAPSPNMTGLDCAKCYPGTVLLEGTQISEGRGTTKPLEVFGAPKMKTKEIKKFMLDHGSHLMQSCFLREHEFEPNFDKFTSQACSGFQIHLDSLWSQKGQFQPYRLISLFLKAFHHIHPDKEWKIDPPYEYEYKKLPIDIISGDEKLKNWVEDSNSSTAHWDNFLKEEEAKWKKERKQFLLYK